MNAELVAGETQYMKIAAVVLQVGAYLLVEHFVYCIKALLILRTQPGDRGAGRGDLSG